MKKTMKTMLALMAGALCLTGCESEDMIEVNNQARLVTLTAYQEGEDATRAAIDGTDSKKIDWTENDKINYFGTATGESMTLIDGAGTTSGTFQGSVTTGTQDYVLYPYQETATCTDGVITAEVPMTQYAVAGSFDPAAALMVGAVNNDGSVQFKNVMSYVKVTIPSDMTNCKQVSLKAKDAWTTVAGKVKITASTGAWAETDTKEGDAFVRLVPQSSETKLTAGASYYIAILPQTMTTGFELIFNDNDDIKVKQSGANVAFARNTTKKLGAITEFTYTVSAVDMASDLKVADRNIGAATSTDYGDYFAWAALRPAYLTKAVSGISFTDLYKTGGFNAANTPYYKQYQYTKYNSTDNKKTLETEDDIAAMLWGGNWRMPTKTELETVYGLGTLSDNDFLCTGQGDYSSNIVFLPAAGYCLNAGTVSVGERGFYWSSTSFNINSGFCILSFDSGVSNNSRNRGLSVRAVLEASTPETPATTGSAKATIDGKEVDVNWVQLWEDGPKFAEYNVGAKSATEVGTTMSSTNATAENFTWGSNWCTPSMYELNELLLAATSEGSTKVKCEYTTENEVYGFKFTGKKDGYTGNSVFFPAQYGVSDRGSANFWSGTANGSKVWGMFLNYSNDSWGSEWNQNTQGYECLVRPVLVEK